MERTSLASAVGRILRAPEGAPVAASPDLVAERPAEMRLSQVVRSSATLRDPWARGALIGTAVLLAVTLLAAAAGPEAQPLRLAAQGALGLFALVVVIVRGAVKGAHRGAWLALAAGFGLTGIASALGMPSGLAAAPPQLSVADGLWLARYPLLYGGLAVLVLAHSPRFGLGQLLDGLLGAFAAAAVFSELTAAGVDRAAPGLADSTVAVRGAYPLLDVLVVGFLVGAAALNGWRLQVWVPLVLGICAFLVSETIDVHAMLSEPGRPLTGATSPGYALSGWLLAVAVLALQRSDPPPAMRPRSIVPPTLLAASAVAALLHGATAPQSASPAVWFAAASVGVVLVRQAATLIENQRLLERSRREATTDALTGLGNRRALTAGLAMRFAEASDSRPLTLALFDLDGFKDYNDRFGHPAGDALLERLAGALAAAVGDDGEAYRMGGDEFCIVIGAHPDRDAVTRRAHAALRATGEGFAIKGSMGVVSVPLETSDVTEALRLADQRMYADKGPGRSVSAQRRATGLLTQILHERDAALGAHTHEVADWAGELARRLRADELTVQRARLGGELHDVGKTALPDAILEKPGPLSVDEWEFMRSHTVIGERILLAHPALAVIAPIARSHHERWDGGGYPDGRRGEDIPLLARIVAVCDAYDAMIADRPYRRGRPPAEALAELERCAGAQFDPAVVRAFVDVIDVDDGEAGARRP